MRLDELDMNQCPDEYHVHNAFKNTNKCDRKSTTCVPILGRKFDAGGYKCECQQGYEYPFNDPIAYFDGQIMEAEYDNMKQDNPSRFDTLKCRIAGAYQVTPSYACIFFYCIVIVIKMTILHGIIWWIGTSIQSNLVTQFYYLFINHESLLRRWSHFNHGLNRLLQQQLELLISSRSYTRLPILYWNTRNAFCKTQTKHSHWILKYCWIPLGIDIDLPLIRLFFSFIPFLQLKCYSFLV
jgi:hypothetical protein